jgi:hypothetical protein
MQLQTPAGRGNWQPYLNSCQLARHFRLASSIKLNPIDRQKYKKTSASLTAKTQIDGRINLILNLLLGSIFASPAEKQDRQNPLFSSKPPVPNRRTHRIKQKNKQRHLSSSIYE